MNEERPPYPVNVAEARSEAMRLLLGILDMAKAMTPPHKLSPIETLATWAAMAESVVADYYGDEWLSFVARVRVMTKTRAN